MPGTFSVIAAAAGLARGTRRVAVTDVDLAGIDLELQPTAVVRGRVLDLQERPAANAKVRALIIERGGSYTPFGPVLTDAAGQFRIEYVDPGALSVVANHGAQGATVLDGGTIAPGEDREVTIRLRGGGIFIRGRITWDDGQRPRSA